MVQARQPSCRRCSGSLASLVSSGAYGGRIFIASEKEPAQQRSFTIEAIIAFPGLDQLDGDDSVIPECCRSGECRLRLQATWTDDGSLDGVIEQKFWAIRTFGDSEETDCIEIKAVSRIDDYVPATRDGFPGHGISSWQALARLAGWPLMSVLARRTFRGLPYRLQPLLKIEMY
jgi:hypothetical protein